LLKEGKNVIFDDLSVEKRDRDALRKTAEACNAHALVIYMDIPAEVAIERQKKNELTKERGLTSDDNMQLVISQLQPPESDEVVVLVKQSYDLNEVVNQIRSSHYPT